MATYAIVKTGGKQYKVAVGDVVKVEKLDTEPGPSARIIARLPSRREFAFLPAEGRKANMPLSKRPRQRPPLERVGHERDGRQRQASDHQKVDQRHRRAVEEVQDLGHRSFPEIVRCNMSGGWKPPRNDRVRPLRCANQYGVIVYRSTEDIDKRY